MTFANSIEIHALYDLDDPRGYCLDIKGHKSKANITKGLQAHTCYSYQGEIAVDQSFDPLNLATYQFFLPAFNVCMEVESVSASAPIQLNKCNFGKRQKFTWTKTGKIHPLSDIGLCLTIDQRNSSKGKGGSPVHLKRAVTLEPCNNSLKRYQTWGSRTID